jgi:hypothetical protein
MTPAAARAPRAVGLALIGLGLLSAVETLRIKDDWSGARLLPAVIALALLALGLAHLRAGAPEGAAAPDRSAGRPGVLRMGAVLAALVGYVASLPALGFLPATAILVVALLRGLGEYRWPFALAVGLGFALAAHAVFRVWLGMPVPAGLLGD